MLACYTFQLDETQFRTVEARACAPPSSGLGGCRHYWDQPRGCSMFNWGPVRICFKPSTSQGRPIPKGARELMGHSLGTLGWEKNRPHALPSYGLLSIGAPTPPHHWAGRGPRSTHVSTGRSAGCPARPRAARPAAPATRRTRHAHGTLAAVTGGRLVRFGAAWQTAKPEAGRRPVGHARGLTWTTIGEGHRIVRGAGVNRLQAPSNRRTCSRGV